MKNFTHSETIRKIAWILLIVGGLNRGLLGLFNFNLVTLIFGYGFFARIVYIIVGLATVYILLYSTTKPYTSLRK
ncbi:MAG TPA: DUF378 domain-containing protein [Candidatus Absconditabacterales bacterium]|nr:DUF378 domain-containing protein [Candidatus Absconditabacterales bacterium]